MAGCVHSGPMYVNLARRYAGWCCAVMVPDSAAGASRLLLCAATTACAQYILEQPYRYKDGYPFRPKAHGSKEGLSL